MLEDGRPMWPLPCDRDEMTVVRERIVDGCSHERRAMGGLDGCVWCVAWAGRRAGAAGKGARSWMFRAAREAALGMMGRPEMDGGAGWAGRRRRQALGEKLLVWELSPVARN